jgi:hypothetical protein
MKWCPARSSNSNPIGDQSSTGKNIEIIFGFFLKMISETEDLLSGNVYLKEED